MRHRDFAQAPRIETDEPMGAHGIQHGAHRHRARLPKIGGAEDKSALNVVI